MKQLNWYQIFGKSNIPDGRTVLPTDDIQIWLNCADIWDKAYTTLAEVLADTDTLLALITSNNAVDYMVRSTTWAVATALVPKMTSDTTPSGVASASTVYQSNSAYKAFDGNDSTKWECGFISSDLYPYVQYDFGSNVEVGKIKVFEKGSSGNAFVYGHKIEYSTDNVTFTEVASGESSSITSSQSYNVDETLNVASGRYFRFRTWRTNQEHFSGADIYTLQYYSPSLTDSATAMAYIGQNNYCANTLLADATWKNTICNSTYFESVLNVKVPAMTSNTTPEGEVRVNNIEGAHYAYLAYDENHNTFWSANARQTTAGVSAYGWSEYNFGKSVYIAMAHIYTVSAVIRNLEVQISDDGVTYTKVQDYTSASTTTAVEVFQKVIMDTHNEANIWRLYYNVYHPADGFWPNANTIQFYGRKDV